MLAHAYMIFENISLFYLFGISVGIRS